MASASEFARLRKATTALVNRKGGLHDVPLVTVARAEMATQWTEILHTLPQANKPAGEQHQNDDGTFPYLPGWDGPIA